MRTRFYDLHMECKDKDGERHVVTVVGRLTQKNVRKAFEENTLLSIGAKTVNGKVSFSKRMMERELTIGVSICHPKDEFDKEVGIKIAKSRIKNGYDCGSVYSNSPTMLTEDAVMAELLVKLSYICTNIDKFID